KANVTRCGGVSGHQRGTGRGEAPASRTKDTNRSALQRGNDRGIDAEDSYPYRKECERVTTVKRFTRAGYVTTVIAILAVMLVGLAPSASAVKVDPDLVPYRNGDTIEIVVPFSPGGGFDTYTRLFAPYFERVLREMTDLNLNVIVRNVP